MNWKVERACQTDSTEADGIKLWQVELLASAVRDVTLGLCLLWNGLVERLDLNDEAGKQALRLQLAKKRGSYPALVTWDPVSASILLSPTEFESLMFFCLRTVRDGVAPVDHLDIEAIDPITGHESGNFALKFPISAPPVSAVEARRRLGL